MRFYLACVLLLAAYPAPPCAAWSAENSTDQRMLDLLEERAAQAPARDQCYLYAELVNETVRYSAQQYASGDLENATKTLQRTQTFAHRFRSMLSGNVKKLKRAQILLRRAAFRLTDLLQASRYEDRPLVKETLMQVDRAQEDAMMQLFND